MTHDTSNTTGNTRDHDLTDMPIPANDQARPAIRWILEVGHALGAWAVPNDTPHTPLSPLEDRLPLRHQ